MTRTDRTAGGAAATERDIDPITLSTVWHGFQSIGREMRHVIDRTAQSYLIAQLHDMAAGHLGRPRQHHRGARRAHLHVPVAGLHGPLHHGEDGPPAEAG